MMITVNEIIKIVKAMFLKSDNSFPLGLETDLLQNGICDSLGLVTLAAEVEKKYPALKIFDQEIIRENFGSVDRILRYLGEKGFEIEKC